MVLPWRPLLLAVVVALLAPASAHAGRGLNREQTGALSLKRGYRVAYTIAGDRWIDATLTAASGLLDGEPTPDHLRLFNPKQSECVRVSPVAVDCFYALRGTDNGHVVWQQDSTLRMTLGGDRVSVAERSRFMVDPSFYFPSSPNFPYGETRGS